MSQRGSSLISVVIATGIAGVVAVALMKMQVFQARFDAKDVLDKDRNDIFRHIMRAVDCNQTFTSYETACLAQEPINLIDKNGNPLLGDLVTNDRSPFHGTGSFSSDGWRLKAECGPKSMIVRIIKSNLTRRGPTEFSEDPLNERPLDFNHPKSVLISGNDNFCSGAFPNVPVPPSPPAGGYGELHIDRHIVGSRRRYDYAQWSAYGMIDADAIIDETPDFNARGRQLVVNYSGKFGYLHGDHQLGALYLDLVCNNTVVWREPVMAGEVGWNRGLNGITDSIIVPLSATVLFPTNPGKQYKVRLTGHLKEPGTNSSFRFTLGSSDFVIKQYL